MTKKINKSLRAVIAQVYAESQAEACSQAHREGTNKSSVIFSPDTPHLGFGPYQCCHAAERVKSCNCLAPEIGVSSSGILEISAGSQS